MSSVKGISSFFPDNKIYQEEVIDFGKKIFSKRKDFSKILKVYKNSGVNVRYLVNNLEWYTEKHSIKTRNILFKKNAILLLKKCIKNTLDKCNLLPENIGGLVVINTTGVLTPTLDAELINCFSFKSNMIRLPIFGYGCAGGVLGLNRAVEIQKFINKPVLVCNIELCSLTFRPQILTKENIISTALFGDGAVSYIVDNSGKCKVLKSMEYTWKKSLDLMGWKVENDGLGVIFDKSIPSFISKNLPKIIYKFSKQKKNGYLLHSGGMKIINAYKKIFGNHESIEMSQKILSDFGNVSSVSVVLVLKEALKKKLNGNYLMAALGPGFTAGLSEIKFNE